MTSSFSSRYPEQWLLGHMVILFLIFSGKTILFSIVAYQFAFAPAVNESFFFSTTSPILVITCLADNSHSNRCEVVSHCTIVLIWISLIAGEVKHLFMYLLAICMSSWGRYVFRSSALFLIGLFVVWVLYIYFGY